MSVIYKCDKCGDEGNPEDMRGDLYFTYGLYSATVFAYVKINDSWVDPSTNDNHHLCNKCVLEIVKKGDVKDNG